MIKAIEQLQQVGLNKYEAEAYYTLLAEGSLTGYELGKRSQVPLSKSYEVLERLTQKGLALIQPGDPSRYMAEDLNRFLGQVRQSMTKTLDDLANSLATIESSHTEGEFWVLRGNQHILARIEALVTDAQQTIYLRIPPTYDAALTDVLSDARRKDCQVFQESPSEQSKHDPDEILLLVDGLEALAGTLAPSGRGQAVVSSNQAIITAIRSFFAQQSPAESAFSSSSSETTSQNDQHDRLDWVAWEDRKQRRLWRVGTNNRVA